MRRCPKCGFLLNENDRYCENCGEDCSAVEDSEVNEVVSPDEEKEKQNTAYEEKVGKTPEFYVVSIGDGPSRLI